MFSLQTRMSDAFAERPELRTMLPSFHPAFRKLQHPVLGKVLPRLVTVADAARVAGVDPDALLAVMNLPGAPKGPLHPVARVDEPAPPWLTEGTVLDVRPTIERGEEPFAGIMEAIRGLGTGQVLTVLAPFEPAPLRRLLEGRGWRSHVRWDGDTCRASFWLPPETTAPSEVDPGERLRRAGAGWTLDVRGLEPPQPLHLALAALDRGALPLTLIHHREPALLYPKLTDRGLTWRVVPHEDHVEIEIHAA